MAIDQRIGFPNYDQLELALHDDGSPPSEANRLPSPSGFADAQSDSDNSDEENRNPTDEVEEPNLSARRTNSATIEWPVMNEEQAKIIDQGIDVYHFAPMSPTRPKVLEHRNISEFERESFMKNWFEVAQMPQARSRWVQDRNATWGLGTSLGSNQRTKQRIQRSRIPEPEKGPSVYVFLNTRTKGFFPIPTSHTNPRIQFKCVD